MQDSFIYFQHGTVKKRFPGQGAVTQEFRGQACLQIGAGGVGEAAQSLGDTHLLQHTCGRCLTIRSGHKHDGQALRESFQKIRTDPQSQLTGQACAPVPCQVGGCRNRPGQGYGNR